MTFAEWISDIYTKRFTGKIEIDFLNGVPRSWSPPGKSVPFETVPVDKPTKVVDALFV